MGTKCDDGWYDETEDVVPHSAGADEQSPFPNFTSLDIKSALAQARLQLEKEQIKRPPVSRSGACVVCKGIVTERYIQQPLVPASELIMGPGGASQYGWVSSGLHCTVCGLMYEFLPPEPWKLAAQRDK